jgi:hypothetical protein
MVNEEHAACVAVRYDEPFIMHVGNMQHCVHQTLPLFGQHMLLGQVGPLPIGCVHLRCGLAVLAASPCPKFVCLESSSKTNH